MNNEITAGLIAAYGNFTVLHESPNTQAIVCFQNDEFAVISINPEHSQEWCADWCSDEEAEEALQASQDA